MHWEKLSANETGVFPGWWSRNYVRNQAEYSTIGTIWNNIGWNHLKNEIRGKMRLFGPFKSVPQISGSWLIYQHHCLSSVKKFLLISVLNELPLVLDYPTNKSSSQAATSYQALLNFIHFSEISYTPEEVAVVNPVLSCMAHEPFQDS